MAKVCCHVVAGVLRGTVNQNSVELGWKTKLVKCGIIARAISVDINVCVLQNESEAHRFKVQNYSVVDAET